MAVGDDILDRLTKLEREVYLMLDAVKEMKSERIVPRIVVLEEVVKQVKDDVTSIKDLSEEIADQIRTQKAMLKVFLWGASLLFGLVQVWPVIKEMLKGVLLP